jgi:hypothetical protein
MHTTWWCNVQRTTRAAYQRPACREGTAWGCRMLSSGSRRHARAAMRPSLSLCLATATCESHSPPPLPLFPRLLAQALSSFLPPSLPQPQRVPPCPSDHAIHAAPQCRCRMLCSFKQLLLKQRDIMVALTNRIAERDATIASLEVCACCTPRVGWRILKVPVQMWPQ